MRADRLKRTTALSLAMLACAVLPASAGATTFGSSLASAPTNEVTCGQGFFPFFTPSSSCTYFSGAPGPTFYAPFGGTVSAVRVRVGPVTGPMQVVVMRSLYQNKAGDPGHPYFACCFVERYGPVFTPAANTITTLPVSLPMTEEPVPPSDDFTTNAAGDFLALSVLAPNVPIPAVGDASAGSSGSGFSAFYPAPTAETVPAPSPNPVFPSTDGFGAQITMSADIEAAGTGGGPPTGGGVPGGGVPGGGVPTAVPVAPARIPTIDLVKQTLPVKSGAVGLPIQCLLVDCTGTLALQNAQQAGIARASAAKKKPKHKVKTVSYGSARFSIAAGKTSTVNVKLNAAGRKLLKGHKSAKAWANVRFSSGGGKPQSLRLTLKRSR